jgi:hypothetical protein
MERADLGEYRYSFARTPKVRKGLSHKGNSSIRPKGVIDILQADTTTEEVA